MAKNEFLPFATGTNADVLTNDKYNTLEVRSSGFGTGIARTTEMNKVWRQGANMASALGQFIADSGVDALDDGNTTTLKSNFAAAINNQATGRLLNIKTFTTSSTYAPTSGTKRIRVRVWGAGGGGQGMAAASNGSAVSGGAGAYAESLIDIATVSNVAVTVGIGGVGVAAGNGSNGGDGTKSAFGNYITCAGGIGGNQSSITQAVATGGTLLNINGQTGQGGAIINSLIVGGVGGGSFCSGNANPHISIASDAGQFPGGGGAMGCYVSNSALQPSGRGANGYVIVEEYA